MYDCLVIVDSVIYVDGRRAAESHSLEETYEACREQRGLAWVGLHKPTKDELNCVAEEFGLDPLAVEDALKAHQRPTLRRYGHTLFVALRTARYLDESETVEFGEIHVFVGEKFVITVRHGEDPALEEVRSRLEGEPELLRQGPAAILYAITERVVDDYAPVVDGLENDIDEIEAEVFGGNADVSRRTYQLSREVIQFQQATRPLAAILDYLTGEKGSEVESEIRRYLSDVREHALHIIERAEGFRALLSGILSVNLTLVGLAQTEASIDQNEEVKKISAWAAILFAPTLIGTVYGMNFRSMPELNWVFGYPFALSLMGLVSLTLYLVFKRRGWL